MTSAPWPSTEVCNVEVEGGRYIKYGAISDNNGNQPIPHNDLLVSLCQLMGLRDVTTFGDPKYCHGGLKNLMRA